MSLEHSNDLVSSMLQSITTNSELTLNVKSKFPRIQMVLGKLYDNSQIALKMRLLISQLDST
jgi:hypothetical protein